MFLSDKPITSNTEDELKRTIFSKMLAEAILKYKKEDTLVLGMCGSWGSGKSSIINLVLEEIDSKIEGQNDSKPIIVKFNPWNYYDSSQLINQFFQVLLSELKLQGKKLSKVGKSLEDYSSLIQYTQFIPKVGRFLILAEPFLKSVGKQLAKKKSVETQKRAVINALKSQSRKLLIIIDDIDRLNNAQIRAVFQLVNAVANFPNVVYLLSFDREIVARALSEEQKCDGEEYLEKIIQVPFDIPKINRNSVVGMFYEKYTDIIKYEFSHPEFDINHMDIVLKECVYPFLDNIRDLKRILNVFEFKYNLMQGEINAVDLLAITVLELYAKKIYDWIRVHISSEVNNILGAGVLHKSVPIEEIEKKNNHYNEEFKAVYPENPHMMGKVIKTLFPKVAVEMNSFPISNESEIDLIKKKRIASNTKQSYYFNLSLEEIPVSQREIEESLYNYRDDQLFEFLKDILKREALYYYLNEVLARNEKISGKRRQIIINGIIKIFGVDIDDLKQIRNISMSKLSVINVIKQLMFYEDKKKNVEIISDSLVYINKNNIFILLKLYEELKDSFIEDNLNLSEQWLKKEDLPKIEDIVLNAIKKLDNQIFNSEHYAEIIRIWKSLDPENMKKRMKEILRNDENVPKLLSLYVGNWSSRGDLQDDKGWSFNQYDYEEYISCTQIYEAILRLKNKGFIKLKDDLKKKAVAYTLWYEKDKSEGIYHVNDISEKDVLHRLYDWEISDMLNDLDGQG